MDIVQGVAALQRFCGPALTRTLADAEAALGGVTLDRLPRVLSDLEASEDAFAGAAGLKQIAGQVHTALHALGILLCLPHILENGEMVQYASLGAGNTGRSFDLETDRRVAEFKFITWRGGPEAFRQNGLFKDFLPTRRASDAEAEVHLPSGNRTPSSIFERRASPFQRTQGCTPGCEFPRDARRTVSDCAQILPPPKRDGDDTGCLRLSSEEHGFGCLAF